MSRLSTHGYPFPMDMFVINSWVAARTAMLSAILVGSIRSPNLISIKAFFLAACQNCYLIFVSVFRPFVSDPFPYLSYRPCLPSNLSLSYCQNIFSQCVCSVTTIVYHYYWKNDDSFHTMITEKSTAFYDFSAERIHGKI